MDLGSMTKSAAVMAPPAPARGDSTLAPGSVRTELPARAVVTAAKAAEKVRYEPTDAARDTVTRELALNSSTRRQLDIDEATSAVVSKVIDAESGEVVRQVPEEALLRMRAYVRERAARSDEAQVATDSETEANRVERIA
jgi:uncharacterized FlaG/YvyC family protein